MLTPLSRWTGRVWFAADRASRTIDVSDCDSFFAKGLNVADEAKLPEQTTTVQVDDSSLQPFYTNFCRVTGTPEEIILDFGLNTEPFGKTAPKIKLSQRMICNFFTAKRLLGALSVAIRKHEDTFGVIETDVNKRVRGRAPSVPDA